MTKHRSVGDHLGVGIEVAAWDGVAATVDLSCACMFTREARGDRPGGGLAHLDAALSGRLLVARANGVFRAERGEILLIDHPPDAVEAAAVLVVGLGDPDDWSTDVMAGAVSTAYASAVLMRVTSVAFAPGMLDSGLSGAQTAGAVAKMIEALTSAIAKRGWLRDEALARASSVHQWVFDVGAARYEDAVAEFAAAIRNIGST